MLLRGSARAVHLDAPVSVLPGHRARRRRGRGAGDGFTVNVPLEAGATDGDYALVFDRVVVPVLDEFAPELVLVSAGFDAHERDPLAHMRMTRRGLRDADDVRCSAVADRHATDASCCHRRRLRSPGADRESSRATMRAMTGARAPAARGTDERSGDRRAAQRPSRAVRGACPAPG